MLSRYLAPALLAPLVLCFAQKPGPAEAAKDGGDSKGVEKKQPKAKEKRKDDPKVAAIAKAMSELVTRARPVHYKFSSRDDIPDEDLPSRTEGELWFQGRDRLRMEMTTQVGGMKDVYHITLNSKGAWVRRPGEPVLRYSPQLLKQFQQLKAKGLGRGPESGAMDQFNILGWLKSKGYQLRWSGEKKVDKVLLDLVEGTLTGPDGRTGNDASRCRILIGRQDRMPRRFELFRGKRRIKVQVYTDIRVGKELAKDTFEFSLKKGEREVDVLDTWMGQSIRNALKKL